MSALTEAWTHDMDMDHEPTKVEIDADGALRAGPMEFSYSGRRPTGLGEIVEIYQTDIAVRPIVSVMVPETQAPSTVTLDAGSCGLTIMTGRGSEVSGMRMIPRGDFSDPVAVRGSLHDAFSRLVEAALAAGREPFKLDLRAPAEPGLPLRVPSAPFAQAVADAFATASPPEPTAAPAPAVNAAPAETVSEPKSAAAPAPAIPARPKGPTKLVVLTGNDGKAAEYVRFFGRYGIRPIVVDSEELPPAEVAAELLASGYTVVLREESDLFRTTGRSDEPLAHLDLVENVSVATVWSDDDGRVAETTIERRVPGFFDANGRIGADTFGWDANFVPLGRPSSLDEAFAAGQKVSARDLVLSEVVSLHMRFAERTDMAFHPAKLERIVDFSLMPHDHLAKLPWLSTLTFRTSMLSRVLGRALRDGVFFRSAETRRERNYWWPGLNGGVPLVAKKDDIHEVTFLFHDLMHAAMPDLILDGGGRPEARRVYVAHRMVGEAISLVLADYLFVDTIQRSGADYDFGKRRIYPFFLTANDALRDAGMTADQAVRELCRANAHYALTGDDSDLRALGGDEAALEAYKEKYGRFFSEDLRWTVANFQRLSSLAELFPRRAGQVSNPLLDHAGLTTVTGFVEAIESGSGLPVGALGTMASRDLVETVFAAAWEGSFGDGVAAAPKFKSDAFDRDVAKSNAAFRYLLGQSVMYARYPHVPAVARMGEIFVNELEGIAASDRVLDDADIARLRAFHEAAVDILTTAGAISPEDARVFREVYPVFPPHFVFYDAKGTTDSLADVAAETLAPLGGATEVEVISGPTDEAPVSTEVPT